MTNQIDTSLGGLKPEYRDKIVGIISVLIPEAKIYLYGSRARGKFRETSDIDLALDAGKRLDRIAVGEAKEVIDALFLPLLIDLVDVWAVSPEMHENIMKDKIVWKH